MLRLRTLDREFYGRVVQLALIASLSLYGCRQDEGASQQPPPLPPDLGPDPAAEEVLGEMIDFMQAQSEATFEAVVSYEAVQASGQKLHFDMIQRVAVRQPDRLFWTTLYDDASVDSVWFQDGVLSMIQRPENVYGHLEVPATIEGMVETATGEYDIPVPFSDLLAGDGRELFLDGLQSSMYAGLAWVDGAWTHHVALSKQNVDVEVWIRAGGDPIPAKLVIIYKGEDGLPSFVARLRNWNFSPAFDERTFQFSTPPDAEPIEMVRSLN